MTLPPEITLHVGLQKTATTLLQRSLRSLRDQLAARGVAYVDRLEMSKLPALRGWRAFRAADDAPSPIHASQPRPSYATHEPGLTDQFTSELRQLAERRAGAAAAVAGEGPRHLILSNEAMVGTQAPDFGPDYRPRAEAALDHVLEALQPEKTTIAVYVRRQDTLIESQYMQWIHAGESIEFTDWAAATTAGPLIAFPELVDRLGKIRTVASVRVRPYEQVAHGARAFVAAFLGEVAGELDLDTLPERPANPSYTEPALQAALALNPLLETRQQIRAARKFLRAAFPASQYPAAELLSAEQRAAVVDMYADSNLRLFREYMPDLPEDSYVTTAGMARLLAGRYANERSS